MFELFSVRPGVATLITEGTGDWLDAIKPAEVLPPIAFPSTIIEKK